jgi:predicted DNA binding CopG/RHH family protein
MPKPRKSKAAVPVHRAARAAVPEFASEAEEQAFWAEQDTAPYVDWSTAMSMRFPDLKPSTATISLRLPEGMLEELRVLANQRDVPYQSLLKVFLAERLAAERARKRRAS